MNVCNHTVLDQADFAQDCPSWFVVKVVYTGGPERTLGLACSDTAFDQAGLRRILDLVCGNKVCGQAVSLGGCCVVKAWPRNDMRRKLAATHGCMAVRISRQQLSPAVRSHQLCAYRDMILGCCTSCAASVPGRRKGPWHKPDSVN